MKTYFRYYSVEKYDKPPILLVHGAGEHLDRYLWVIGKLNQAGYNVLGGDLPGYGRSEGKRGHINSFHDYIQAVSSWYNELKSKTPQKPFIFGHSLGGLVVARFMEIKQPEAAGVVFSSPCFGLSMDVPAWKDWIGRTLNVIYPSLVLSAGIKPEHVSRNLEITQKYIYDPLNTKGASVRWYNELVVNMLANLRDSHLFPNIPLLIHQAGSDYVVDARKSKQWFEGVALEDKTYREWPGLYHEILNEPERNEVMSEIIEWLEARGSEK